MTQAVRHVGRGDNGYWWLDMGGIESFVVIRKGNGSRNQRATEGADYGGDW